MIDLKTLRVMLGLDSDYISMREQKMVMEEVEYLAAKVSGSDGWNTTMTLSTPVVKSILRALVSEMAAKRAMMNDTFH